MAQCPVNIGSGSKPVSLLCNLFPEPPPIGGADVAAGKGVRRECDDLVDLAPGDFHVHGRVQEIGLAHHQLQRFIGGRSSTRHPCGNFSTKR